MAAHLVVVFSQLSRTTAGRSVVISTGESTDRTGDVVAGRNRCRAMIALSYSMVTVPEFFPGFWTS